MMFKSRLDAFDSASELPAVAGWMGGGHFQVILDVDQQDPKGLTNI